jgi:hypothetical protein
MKKTIKNPFFNINYLITILLISFSSLAHSQNDPANLDLFCSGVLLRTSGLISQNINRYSGDARAQLTQVSSHLENNGNLLMMRGMQRGGKADSANNGGSWANNKVGSNVLVILQKGSEQNSIVMDCLTRTNK